MIARKQPQNQNGRPMVARKQPQKPKRATNGRPYKQISAETLFSLPIFVIMIQVMTYFFFGRRTAALPPTRLQSATRFVLRCPRPIRAHASRVRASCPTPHLRCCVIFRGSAATKTEKGWQKPSLFCFGRGRRTRTHDPWFWRPVLYQLSYTPVFLHRFLCNSAIIPHLFSLCNPFFRKN